MCAWIPLYQVPYVRQLSLAMDEVSGNTRHKEHLQSLLEPYGRGKASMAVFSGSMKT